MPYKIICFPLVSAALCIMLAAPFTAARALTVYNVDYLPGTDYREDKDRLDIYMPDIREPVPVVVFFHGGGLRMGSKEDVRVVAARLVRAGLGVVLANYRLSPAVMHPGHVQDAAAATAWVFRHIRDYGGDPDNIFLAGHSAGAYLAVLLTLEPAYLRAQGPGPFALQGTVAISPFLYVEETAAARPKDVWGRDPADWLAASVTHHIRGNSIPLLLIYADGDASWRKRQNETFAAAMQAADNDVRVIEVTDRDHMSLINRMNEADDRTGQLILEFVRELTGRTRP